MTSCAEAGSWKIAGGKEGEKVAILEIVALLSYPEVTYGKSVAALESSGL